MTLCYKALEQVNNVIHMQQLNLDMEMQHATHGLLGMQQGLVVVYDNLFVPNDDFARSI